jgi:uncharacterized protein (UPF0332 family)
MSKKLSDKRLNRVAEAECKVIGYWKEGVSLENDSGKTINELILQTAIGRWRLAYDHRYHANRLLSSNPPHYRSAVSRYYYAMYHSLRACVYIYNMGDDFQEHSKLPLKIPADFPQSMEWQIKMKNARLTRNRADYEPFPRSDRVWQRNANNLKTDADQLIIVSRNYLKNKGCEI